MLEGLTSLYRPQYAKDILSLLRLSNYSFANFENKYWRTRDFSSYSKTTTDLSGVELTIVAILWSGMALQIALSCLLALWGARSHGPGVFQLGIAAALATPLVWGQLVALSLGAYQVLYAVAHPKKIGRAVVAKKLERQIATLRKKNDFKVVLVAGSVGKTSTKLAIVKVLEASGLRVQFQDGNYNDRITVPLIFFGKTLPPLTNPVAWVKTFNSNASEMKSSYPYDVVVIEIGTDGPGQLKDFEYLEPDVSVVTAISLEHTEYFESLDDVAREELSVAKYSKELLINIDDIDSKYLKGLSFKSYGLSGSADFKVSDVKDKGLKGQTAKISLGGSKTIPVTTELLGKPGLKIVLASVAVASLLGVEDDLIAKALETVTPVQGRMQVLQGKKGSTIIDDTYNSSPIANIAALDVLYKAIGKQKIAILGSMNELGDFSEQSHREVGQYCDPAKVDLVVTIGEQAERWLAPEALERGCTVASFLSPYEAGQFVLKNLNKGAVVLAKGSQNKVFAEEALKDLLAKKSDSLKLVRQSDSWMRIKQRQFK